MKNFGEFILKLRQMGMNSSIMRKENPKKYWLVITRLILGTLFFLSMFLHFYVVWGTGVNAFQYDPSVWLYIVVFVGLIIAYYVLEFTEDKKGHTIYKIHSVFALFHFGSMLIFVMSNGLTIKIWAFLQLLFVIIMILLAFFPKLLMSLIYKIFKISGDNVEDDEVKQIEEVEYVDKKE